MTAPHQALHPQVDTLVPGLIAVTGDEGTGKTTYLRRLCGALPTLPALTTDVAHPDAQWLDLGLPGQDNQTPQEVWSALQARCPGWNPPLQQELIEALGMSEHLDKKLFMLSRGSRRKVALVGLLACGACVTCLDQPYAALDWASVQVIRDFLNDMAEHPTRSWVVADYEADPSLPWRRVISLD